MYNLKWNFSLSQRCFKRYSSCISSSNETTNCNLYDVAVIGGGIVGTATGREILIKNDQLKCSIIEKENHLAAHQSGKNSGVIHAGIYYTPGSVKAKFCTRGMDLMYKYLDKTSIPYKKCGKLIVATDFKELETLQALLERGKQNGVKDLKLVCPDEIKKIEPHVYAVRGLHSPNTGIVDFAKVTESFASDFKKLGGKIHTNFKVSSIRYAKESQSGNCDLTRYPIEIISERGKAVYASFVLICAGLYSDKLAIMTGGRKDPAIIPIRGEYLCLKPEKENLVRGNIYPVPDMRVPFLGVHITPRMDGKILIGPTAVLAFSREGYHLTDISPKEMWETFSFGGFRKLAYRYYQFGIRENLKAFHLGVADVQKFLPDVTRNDVIKGPSGVRAQAVSESGDLIDDFIFDEVGSRILHCRNAPSPAATSSLAIAEELSTKVLNSLKTL